MNKRGLLFVSILLILVSSAYAVQDCNTRCKNNNYERGECNSRNPGSGWTMMSTISCQDIDPSLVCWCKNKLQNTPPPPNPASTDQQQKQPTNHPVYYTLQEFSTGQMTCQQQEGNCQSVECLLSRPENDVWGNCGMEKGTMTSVTCLTPSNKISYSTIRAKCSCSNTQKYCKEGTNSIYQRRDDCYENDVEDCKDKICENGGRCVEIQKTPVEIKSIEAPGEANVNTDFTVKCESSEPYVNFVEAFLDNTLCTFIEDMPDWDEIISGWQDSKASFICNSGTTSGTKTANCTINEQKITTQNQPFKKIGTDRTAYVNIKEVIADSESEPGGEEPKEVTVIANCKIDNSNVKCGTIQATCVGSSCTCPSWYEAPPSEHKQSGFPSTNICNWEGIYSEGICVYTNSQWMKPFYPKGNVCYYGCTPICSSSGITWGADCAGSDTTQEIATYLSSDKKTCYTCENYCTNVQWVLISCSSTSREDCTGKCGTKQEDECGKYECPACQEVLTCIKGNLNDDMKVDTFDLFAMLGVLAGTATNSKADINCDSEVNVLDLTELLSLIGNGKIEGCCPTQCQDGTRLCSDGICKADCGGNELPCTVNDKCESESCYCSDCAGLKDSCGTGLICNGNTKLCVYSPTPPCPDKDPATICKDVSYDVLNADGTICKTIIGTKDCTGKLCPDKDPATICKDVSYDVLNADGTICKTIDGTGDCTTPLPACDVSLTIPATKCGDVCPDDKIDAKDLSVLSDFVLGGKTKTDLGLNAQLGDIDGSGDFNTEDLLLIQNAINGMSLEEYCSIKASVCGNGIVETSLGETCEDGNTVSGDGCSSTCRDEDGTVTCGNRILETGEKCDCGNPQKNEVGCTQNGLGRKTCSTLNSAYPSGPLSCYPPGSGIGTGVVLECTYNTQGCNNPNRIPCVVDVQCVISAGEKCHPTEYYCYVPPPVPSPVCTLTSASIELQDTNNNGKADKEEKIIITAETTGDCSEIKKIQIDAKDSLGQCIIQHTNEKIIGIDGDITSSNLVAEWIIPSIPSECQDKLITSYAAGLYKGEIITANHISGIENPSGFFQFAPAAEEPKECTTDQDCKDPTKPKCNLQINKCEPETILACASNSNTDLSTVICKCEGQVYSTGWCCNGKYSPEVPCTGVINPEGLPIVFINHEKNGLEVTFTPTITVTSPKYIDHCTWEFGDGTTKQPQPQGCKEKVIHTYDFTESKESFNVILTVHDNKGKKGEGSLYITLEKNPEDLPTIEECNKRGTNDINKCHTPQDGCFFGSGSTCESCKVVSKCDDFSNDMQACKGEIPGCDRYACEWGDNLCLQQQVSEQDCQYVCIDLTDKSLEGYYFNGKKEYPQRCETGTCWECPTEGCKFTSQDGTTTITYIDGECINGFKEVTKQVSGVGGTETLPPQPCSVSPVIPFFTVFNIILTLSILTVFYLFRKKF